MERKDGPAPAGNAVRGDVHGPVLQVGTVEGNVHLHQDAPRVHVVAAAAPAPVFGAGARVSVGGREYVVHDHLVEEFSSADGGVLYRQARVSSSTRSPGWLRQVDDRDGTGAGRALADEHALLGAPDLPTAHQFHRDDRVTTLVTSWPRERSGRPSESLHQLLDDGPAGDRANRLCTGLAGLCDTLAALHDRGHTHRALSPAALVARDDGRLVPRDLGLAAHAVRRGEHPGHYQAPEQRGRGTPGPWTDVHQVAAIAHRILTGRPPRPAGPPPVRAWEPAVPEALAVAVDAALAPDPAARPGIRSLGTALRHPVR